MSKQLKQVINLSKKTGDRIIVFDNSEPNDSFVVMTLGQYERIIGEYFQDSSHNEGDGDSYIDNKKTINNGQVLTEKKIIDKIENTENNDNSNLPNRSLRNNNWQIPPQVKQESEG